MGFQGVREPPKGIKNALQVHPAINSEENDFAKAMPETLRGLEFDGTIGCGRGVGNNSVINEHFFHAVQMEAIADDERRFEAFGMKQIGCGSNTVVSRT